MKSIILPGRYLLVFFLVVFVVLSPILLPAIEEKPVESTEKIVVDTPEQKTTLINIYSWATILPKELIDLQNEIAKEKKVKAVEENLPTFSLEINELRKETTEAQKNPELQAQQVSSLLDRTQRVAARLQKASEPLTKLITLLSENRKQWMGKKTILPTLRNRMKYLLLWVRISIQNC